MTPGPAPGDDREPGLPEEAGDLARIPVGGVILAHPRRPEDRDRGARNLLQSRETGRELLCDRGDTAPVGAVGAVGAIQDPPVLHQNVRSTCVALIASASAMARPT